MSTTQLLASAHEFVPVVSHFGGWAVLFAGYWGFTWNYETEQLLNTPRTLAITALALSIWAIGVWYELGPGQDANAVAQWFGGSIPSAVADHAEKVTSQIEDVLGIGFDVFLAIVFARHGNRSVSICFWVLAGLSIFFSINNLFG